MLTDVKKSLSILHEDLSCNYKTISTPNSPLYPLDEGVIFHKHDGYELLLLLSGKINFYVEQYGECLAPGDLVCVRPYAFHLCELIDTSAYDRIVVNIQENVMKSLSTDRTDLSRCFFRSDGLNLLHLTPDETGRFLSCAQLLEESLSSEEYGSDIMTNTYIRQLLVLVNRHSAKCDAPAVRSILPGLIAAVIDYTDAHIQEDISLSSIAKELNYNGTYISRSFQKFSGIPLQQYILTKKITLAQKLLREGNSPCDVCFLTGFHNYSNFSRTFSKYAGQSPKQYQQGQLP